MYELCIFYDFFYLKKKKFFIFPLKWLLILFQVKNIMYHAVKDSLAVLQEHDPDDDDWFHRLSTLPQLLSCIYMCVWCVTNNVSIQTILLSAIDRLIITKDICVSKQSAVTMVMLDTLIKMATKWPRSQWSQNFRDILNLSTTHFFFRTYLSFRRKILHRTFWREMTT